MHRTHHQVCELRPESGYRLFLRFEDGLCGTIDLTSLIRRGGEFARIAEQSAFASVTLDPDGQHVHWGPELELCADALYERFVAARASR